MAPNSKEPDVTPTLARRVMSSAWFAPAKTDVRTKSSIDSPLSSSRARRNTPSRRAPSKGASSWPMPCISTRRGPLAVVALTSSRWFLAPATSWIAPVGPSHRSGPRCTTPEKFANEPQLAPRSRSVPRTGFVPLRLPRGVRATVPEHRDRPPARVRGSSRRSLSSMSGATDVEQPVQMRLEAGDIQETPSFAGVHQVAARYPDPTSAVRR